NKDRTEGAHQDYDRGTHGRDIARDPTSLDKCGVWGEVLPPGEVDRRIGGCKRRGNDRQGPCELRSEAQMTNRGHRRRRTEDEPSNELVRPRSRMMGDERQPVAK